MQSWCGRTIYATLKQIKAYNFTTNTQKAYLSAHVHFLFKCFYDQQDSCRCPKSSQKTAKRKSVRQRNCHFFVSFLLRPLCSTVMSRKRLEYSPSLQHKTQILITARSSTAIQRLRLQIHPGQQNPFTTLCGCCPLRRTSFSNFACTRTRYSLVPRRMTTVISLGATLDQCAAKSRVAQWWRGLLRLQWGSLVPWTSHR